MLIKNVQGHEKNWFPFVSILILSYLALFFIYRNVMFKYRDPSA